jgi:3-dehydroquinate synthase
MSQEQLFIGRNLLDDLARFARPLGSRFAVITDSVMEALFARAVFDALKKIGCDVSLFSVPAGEPSKTRETKALLEDRLIAQKFGRDSCIIAVGGGVILDLVGFLAATYCRGVPLLFVPTSLLAMADASLGGKNGVNHPLGKNMIGTIYPPKATFMDLNALSTLSEKEFKNGYAEIIKHGLIADAKLFELMEKSAPKPPLEEIIRLSTAVKKAILDKDPLEKGERVILNFGHTVGHALETLSAYHLSHGEAIAIGMALESLICRQLGFLTEQETQRIFSIFKRYGFSLKPPAEKRILYETMCRDKKAKQGRPRFVILKTIGAVVPFDGEYCTEVDEPTFSEAYELLSHSAE